MQNVDEINRVGNATISAGNIPILSNFNIREKILSGYFIVMTLMVLIAALLLFNLSSLVGKFDFLVQHDLLVLQKAENMTRLLVDGETGMRGFLVTGNEEFLEPFNNAHGTLDTDGNINAVGGRFDVIYNELYDLVSYNPAQQAALNEILIAREQWLEDVAIPLITNRREETVEAFNFSRLSTFLGSGIGKEYMDAMRELVSAWIDEEVRLNNVRAEDISSTTTQIWSVTVTLTAIGLVISLSIGFYVGSKISGNIRIVMRAAQRVTEGDFNQQVTINSKDETWVLGQAFNNMVVSLRERNKELNCLYGISRLVEQEDTSLDDILRGTVDLIPSSWQHSEITCASITLGEKIYGTTDCPANAPGRLVRDIMVHGEKVGTISICYLEKMPDADEGPFLKEELALIDAIAERLGRIVERSQAEESLKKSEERFRFLAENAQDMIYRMSLPDGLYEYVSPASVQLFGYTPEEFYETPLLIRQVMHPDWLDYFAEEWTKLLAGQMPSIYEYQIIHTSGEVRWLHQRNVLFVDDDQNPYAMMGIVTDITGRKQAEEALRNSQQFLADLVSSLSDAVFTVKMPERSIEFANSAITTIFGYTPEEVLGQTTRMFYPDDAGYREFGERLVEAMKKGERLQTEQQLCRQNGEHFWADITTTFRYQRGQLTQVISVIRDITERKQAEEQERKFMQERDRRRILRNFITQASHEFRTPLSMINTSVYFLSKLSNSEEQQKRLRRIEQQVTNVTSLVDTMITMTKLDVVHELDIEAVNLGKLVETIIDDKKEAFASKHINSQYELKIQSQVKGDNQYLRQAIELIIDNAIRYTSENDSIMIRVDRKEEHMIVEITDTGIGIDGEILPHIFERFYRADQAGNNRGFGLGLPIAKRIVELHQGSIEVESEVGKGSTFRILLPGNIEP